MVVEVALQKDRRREEAKKQLPLVSIDMLAGQVVYDFTKCLSRSILFYTTFFTVLVLECVAFFFFLAPLVDAFFIGIALSVLFFTLLLFFTLRLYFEEEKLLALQALKNQYVHNCKRTCGYQEENPTSCLQVANALFQPVGMLQEREQIARIDSPHSLYRLPLGLQQVAAYFSASSSSFILPILEAALRSDILYMKELLLEASIEEHIKLVRMQPTNLEVHAALANAYVMLSTLYQQWIEPQEAAQRHSISVWLRPTDKMIAALKIKFRLACQKAMEEFSILKEYAPDDPWVHTQLAYSFRDLGMTDKEIQEYEILSTINPADNETLYKLGSLYFTQGHNAKGLAVYERLRSYNTKRAHDLIQHYGTLHSVCK